MTAPDPVLTARFQAAFAAAFGPEYADADPVIRPSQFADFQVNAAMAMAKKLGTKPRDIATQLVEHVDLAGIAEPLEVSGPGFLNITLLPEWVAARAAELTGDARLGVPRPGDAGAPAAQTIPVDYSAPNVAKEMHVGHLRTTVVGDALARTLEALGHTVVRQNHIGDWGTPFGMLIEHLLEVGTDSDEAALLRTSPNDFYQAARAKFDGDEEFAARSRARVVALQGGDEETLAIWRTMIELSKAYFNGLYSTLGVTLTDADLAGESTYNDQLAAVCDELEAKGLAQISDGALCVFPAGFTGRDEEPLPLIIRKSDGGYGYATTDLAAIRHRLQDLGADRILYVVGAPQALHFRMLFQAAREAGWMREDVEAVHVQIGNVLGTDGKILRTRSGAPVRLASLLQEAVDTARGVIDELRPELPAEQRSDIARQIGIGAVKYADLSVAHDSEYVFDLGRMVALTGNTAPYLQYAVARIRSILRKAEVAVSMDAEPVAIPGSVAITEEPERLLALQLLEFGGVLATVGAELEPHKLAGYLFELAQAFTTFYDKCPILIAEPAVRASRLQLAKLTERTLVRGLSLLGVEAPAQM